MHLDIAIINKHSINFTTLEPNIFYKDINDGIQLFVDCLEFSIEQDKCRSGNLFCVLEKDRLRINLFRDAAFAGKHNPEFRLVTADIE